MSFKRIAKSVFFWTGMMGIFLLMLSLFGLLFLETKFNIEKIAILSVFWGTSFGIIINLNEEVINFLSFSFGLALGILTAVIFLLFFNYGGLGCIYWTFLPLLFLTGAFCFTFLVSQKYKMGVILGIIFGFVISFFVMVAFFENIEVGMLMTIAYSNVVAVGIASGGAVFLMYLFWLQFFKWVGVIE